MSEKDEPLSKPDAREADGGAAAAMFAMGSASRAQADAYLEKQTKLSDIQVELGREQVVLARLQAEEFRREDSLRHWSLRVRHISDVMKLSFEIAVAFIVLAIAAFIGGAVWAAAHADGLVIELFNVPADMAVRGLSGQVVAAKLLDRLTVMQNESASSRPAASFASDWTHDIKVAIPETGVSLGELERYLREWLGHEMHLSGDVYETANGVALTIRLGDAPGETFAGRLSDLDKLTEQAAEAVFRTAQPYRFAGYIGPREGRTAEALAIFNDLARTGGTEDRAWANDELGVLAMYVGNFAQARLDERRAMRTDLHLPYPPLIYPLSHRRKVTTPRRSRIFANM